MFESTERAHAAVVGECPARLTRVRVPDDDAAVKRTVAARHDITKTDGSIVSVCATRREYHP